MMAAASEMMAAAEAAPAAAASETMTDTMAAAEAAPAADIVDTAVAAGSFNTLVQAVKVAGLVDTLKSKGPFTVFAPTDEAFAAVPADTLNALLADPKALAQVLLYHVVPGAVKSTDLSDGMTAPTAQGEDVTFGVSSGGVKVNDANVVSADIDGVQRHHPRHRQRHPAAQHDGCGGCGTSRRCCSGRTGSRHERRPGAGDHAGHRWRDEQSADLRGCWVWRCWSRPASSSPSAAAWRNTDVELAACAGPTKIIENGPGVNDTRSVFCCGANAANYHEGPAAARLYRYCGRRTMAVMSRSTTSGRSSVMPECTGEHCTTVLWGDTSQ